jgi:hypothetical protein
MPAGKTVLSFLRKTGLVLGALFLVTVLLSAMPGHHAPDCRLTAMAQDPQPSAPLGHDMQGMDHTGMAGMDRDDARASEQSAVSAMTAGHHPEHSLHMKMTALRPPNGQDAQRAAEIAAHLRDGIEKYKDYRAALKDGYSIFLPDLPQPEYHFTSYRAGFLEAFRFDPSRPTSLLYRKTPTGYELVGAMYTMPRLSTEQQLDQRVPLSVATWHLHTNLCMPPKGDYGTADWTRFGLKGSIATREACDANGGRFQPSIFGWMVHVYPYQDSLDRIYSSPGMD